MSRIVMCPCCRQTLEIVEMGFGTEAYPFPFDIYNGIKNITATSTSSLHDYCSKTQNINSEEQLQQMIQQGIVNRVKNDV